ncbi:MAG TPA: hypothetical protein VGQ64_01885 [Candidatus Limnocylindrales bacterium]|jgi:hypothetical protein|nr:hypothetical protein [Candidatus Limnocylindrales bacterium]
MTRLRALIVRSLDDVVALIGIGLIAFGLGQLPAPWGSVLGPIALGLGLIGSVAAGRR